ncbi:MAG TPA: hypothetical protein PKV72_04540, partial [Candidatus Peribacteria bacterium]|nr:hypothetical protein [Candidatus Peribacteria bacterium]
MDASLLRRWRPAILFGVAVGVPVLLQSIAGYAGPVAQKFLPLPPQHYHLAILLTGFALWLWHDDQMTASPLPGKRQTWLSAAGAVIAAAGAFILTHPSSAARAAWADLPLAAGVAMSTATYLLLLSPGALAFGAFYPWRLLRRCAGPLLLCAVLALGFVLTGIIATVWHLQLARPALDLSAWLLRLIDPAAVTVETDTAIIGFREFATRVGPQCAALDGVLLFLLLAVTLWWQRSRKRAASSFAAIAAGAVVLFLLNGVRIAAIV